MHGLPPERRSSKKAIEERGSRRVKTIRECTGRRLSISRVDKYGTGLLGCELLLNCQPYGFELFLDALAPTLKDCEAMELEIWRQQRIEDRRSDMQVLQEFLKEDSITTVFITGLRLS